MTAGIDNVLPTARDAMTRTAQAEAERPPSTCAGPRRPRPRARLNRISHILGSMPFRKVPRDKVTLPRRAEKTRYDDQASLRWMTFVTERY